MCSCMSMFGQTDKAKVKTFTGKEQTWDYPEGRMNPNLFPGYTRMQISKVEFTPEATNVYINLHYSSSHNSFRFSPETSLKADGKSYRLIDTKGLNPDNSYTPVPQIGSADIVLSFEPLPSSTERFDLIEGSADRDFNFYGVKERGNDLKSSSWRDVKSGDWIISFFPDFAVFDSRNWEYAEKDFDKGRFVITDGEKSVKVTAGKEKNGIRKLTIGDYRDQNVSRITTIYNTAYPGGGPTEFTDNGFREGDSITINGWYKDMPDHLWNISKDMKVSYTDCFTGRDQVFTAKLDSIGRFSLKFPVQNTTSVFIDWGRSNLTLPVEPECSYYLLNDFTTGQIMWMGERSRLLNELVSILPEDSPKPPSMMDNGSLRAYFKYLKTCMDENTAAVDKASAEFPNLSPLWSDYKKGSFNLKCASFAQQLPHFNETGSFPEGMKEWLTDEIWPSLPTIPTVYNSSRLNFFMKNLIKDLKKDSPYYFVLPLTTNMKISQIEPISISQYEDIKEELDSIRHKIKMVVDYGAEMNAMPYDIAERGSALFERIHDYNLDHGADGAGRELADLQIQSIMLDSLHSSPIVRDICNAAFFTDIIDQKRESLPTVLENSIDSVISHTSVRNAVHRLNDSYKELAAAVVELGNGKMVRPEELDGLTSGKEIFEKITEPFKGKLILIDVWGTWCGPCKAALKDFTKEKEELAAYDVVFMFLANRSPEQAWKNVIAEYDLTGDNVVHYNLPEAQDNAIGNYLQVKGYPTYVLVNTDGTPFFDVNADPRYGSLVPLIERLTGNFSSRESEKVN